MYVFGVRLLFQSSGQGRTVENDGRTETATMKLSEECSRRAWQAPGKDSKKTE